MKKIILLFVLALGFGSCGSHPAQSTTALTSLPEQTAVGEGQPLYLSGTLYEELNAQISGFPTQESKEQKADEKELRRLHKSRTEKECARATSEASINLKNFFAEPYGSLTAKQVEILAPFFEQIQSDSGYYIKQIKKNYKRQRPYTYMADLEPCVPKENSLSYPSGHATLSKLDALILADLLPKQKKKFLKRAEVIAHDRVLGGVHHPSDIAAGKKLGAALYGDFSKSKLFQDDLEKYKKLLQQLLHN